MHAFIAGRTSSKTAIMASMRIDAARCAHVGLGEREVDLRAAPFPCGGFLEERAQARGAGERPRLRGARTAGRRRRTAENVRRPPAAQANLELLLVDEPLQFPVEHGARRQTGHEPVPVPVGAESKRALVARGPDVAALHLHAAREAPLVGVHRHEELRAPEADAARLRLGGPVRSIQKADPLPEDAAAPALGDELLAVLGLERALEDLRDSLVRLEVPDVNAAREVEELGAKTDGRLCPRPRGRFSAGYCHGVPLSDCGRLTTAARPTTRSPRRRRSPRRQCRCLRSPRSAGRRFRPGRAGR